MASKFSEAVAVVVAVGATAASVFFASPPGTSTASLGGGPKRTKSARPAGPSGRTASSASVVTGDTEPGDEGVSTAAPDGVSAVAVAEGADVADDAEDFAVNEGAFMAPTGPGLVRIGSFNMLHVGERTEKDYRRLARIVGQFDLCGVLELENEQALRDLTAALGPDWRHVISDREAGDPLRRGTFEFYGFVYRSSKVTPLDAPTGFFPDADGIFSREPFFTSFRSGKFDFTMTLLHAESPGNSANLTRELEHLPDVFRYVQNLDPNENDVLLAGDFNRSMSTSSGGPTPAWQPFLALPQMDCVIPDTSLTSLSSNPTGFANHYDDICLTRDATREFSGARGAFDFVAAMFEKQNGPAKKFVSDHIPVWADFRTDQPDDDGAAAPAPTDSDSPNDPATCCRICKTSKPCGDTCIPSNLTCSRPPGCACSR